MNFVIYTTGCNPVKNTNHYHEDWGIKFSTIPLSHAEEYSWEDFFTALNRNSQSFLEGEYQVFIKKTRDDHGRNAFMALAVWDSKETMPPPLLEKRKAIATPGLSEVQHALQAGTLTERMVLKYLKDRLSVLEQMALDLKRKLTTDELETLRQLLQ